MTLVFLSEVMMNPNEDRFIHGDNGSFGSNSGATGTMLDQRFLGRIRAFERCYTSELHGELSFLAIAAADLLRTVPRVQHRAEVELRSHDPESTRTALRQYIRTLQLLRQTLQTALAIEKRLSTTG